MLELILPKGRWASQEEYVIPCPFCPGGDHPYHNHCYLNPIKGLYHCFRCGQSGPIRHVLETLGIDPDILTQMKDQAKRAAVPIEERKFDFPVVGATGSFYDKMAANFLRNRGMSQEDFVTYDVRYAAQGRFDGRVIVPVCESGRLVCFVARAIFSSKWPKYLYPHRGETILIAGEAIFGYDGYTNEKVVLVECVFDAIAFKKKVSLGGFRPMAILGKALSHYQLAKLWRLPAQAFYIMLDNDARKDAIKLAADLVSRAYVGGTMRSVHLCRVLSKDPAEASADELEGVLREAEEATESSLPRVREREMDMEKGFKNVGHVQQEKDQRPVRRVL